MSTTIQLAGKTVGRVGLGLLQFPIAIMQGRFSEADALGTIKAATDAGATAWSSAMFYGTPADPRGNLKLMRAFFDKVGKGTTVLTAVPRVQGQGRHCRQGRARRPAPGRQHARAHARRAGRGQDDSRRQADRRVWVCPAARRRRRGRADAGARRPPARGPLWSGRRERAFGGDAPPRGRGRAHRRRRERGLAVVDGAQHSRGHCLVRRDGDANVLLLAARPRLSRRQVQGARGRAAAAQRVAAHAGGRLLRQLQARRQARRAGAAKGITVAQMTLAWVLALSPQMLPIPGTASRERAMENAQAAKVKLTQAELAEINAIVDAFEPVGARYPGALVDDLMQ